MDPLYKFDDTIAAIATPPGHGAIGIVRMSGPRALAIADEVFQIKGGALPSGCASHTVHFGRVVREVSSVSEGFSGEGRFDVLDEALLVVMRGPRSYTGDDVVELNCHGGPVVVGAVLRLLVERGARLAEPGEFTKRAFLKGRMDLTQAEAVLAMIQSKTEAFMKVSAHQLKGDLTLVLESIRSELLDVYAQLEAAVNFPEDVRVPGLCPGGDEDGGLPSVPAGPLAATEQALSRIRELIASSRHGLVLKDGVRAVLCGTPNVGKSSLLNRLLKQPRAIVSPYEGTTRDTIEETVSVNGIPFQLVDTAGILHPRDMIEEDAVRRSRMYIASADLIVFVVDGSRAFTAEDEGLAASFKDKNVLVVVNKCDLPVCVSASRLQEVFPGKDVVRVSALTDSGIPALEDRMMQAAVPDETYYARNIMVSNSRHVQALGQAEECLLQAVAHLGAGLSWEFVSEDIKSAIRALDQITGRDIDSDVLEKIFSEFCIGK